MRLDEHALSRLLARHLTDDRVFGVLSCHQLDEFIDPVKREALQAQVELCREGIIVIYGPGAALVNAGDILVYADLPRWEIQQRMRSGELANWGAANQHEDILRRYKRAFFIEWRVFDRHKTRCYGVLIISWIPPRRMIRRWSAAMHCAPGCNTPPNVLFV